MAAVELALKALDVPEVNGLNLEEIIDAGERIPGMTALWDVATVEERYEMVTIILEPGGLYYDLENKIIAAIKPRPAFLPVLRMLNGVMEFDETRGLLVTEHWCDRNRRALNHRSHLCLIPLEVLFRNINELYLVYFADPTSDPLANPFEAALTNPKVVVGKPHRQPANDPNNTQWKIPLSEWGTLLRRAEHEPLRQIARDYNVSYEAVRRVIRAARKQQGTE